MLHFSSRGIYLVSLLVIMAACSRSKPSTQSLPVAKAADQGKQIFTTNCISCHNLEQEEIGPRLGGITQLMSQDQLMSFIKNPAKFVEKGDKRTLALTQRYKMVMPPFDFLSDTEIGSILQYIETESKSKKLAPLLVDTSDVKAGSQVQRLAAPILPSDLKIELEEFATVPFSSEKMPRTRIATMRPAPSGDGSLFVSDQRGVIYHIVKGKPQVFVDVRKQIDHFVNEPGLGTGLGSFAFHPDYLENGLIYMTHTETFEGKKADYEFPEGIKVALQWVLTEWKMDQIGSPVFQGERRELLRINVPGTVHGTQEIGFMPDVSRKDKNYGLLFVGTGDGGATIGGHPELCHTLKSLLGTIIRIDPRGNNSKNGQYGIPADNPFVDSAGVYKEIYAYGFRNPHRMSWYKGKMFSTEVGEANFEEINLIEKGGDYGWNVREGNYGISPKDLKNVYAENDSDRRFVPPFAMYDHYDGAAISGGSVYEGKIQALKGKYIFGDIVSGRIFYMDLEAQPENPAIRELTIMFQGKKTSLIELTGTKRVDIRVDFDRRTGELYIMTKPDGKIRRVKGASLE